MLKKVATLSLLFNFQFLCIQCQTTFNTRIDYYNSLNGSGSIALINDTCYIPCSILKPGSANWWEVSMIKLDMNGIYQKGNTYGSNSHSYLSGGLNAVYFNNSILCSGTAGDSITFPFGSIQASYYQFGKTILDSVKFNILTDTTYYNSISAMKKIDNTKMVMYGYTDSICGYKPIIYIVDTMENVLLKKEYLSTCIARIPNRIDINNQKGFIMCGFEQTPGFTTGSVFAIKTDSLGNQLWAKYYGNINTNISSVIATKTSGYMIATNEIDSTYLTSFYWSSMKLYRLDENGDTIWTKKIGNKSVAFSPTSIKQLPNYDFIISGVRTIPHYDIGGSLVSEQLYGFLCRIDSSGNVKWFNDYRGSGLIDTSAQNYLYDVVQVNDGGFISVGFVSPTDTSSQDTWVIKVDSMGCFSPGCNSTVGVTEELNADIQITAYPNPFTNEINVTIDILQNIDENTYVQLIEPVTGRVIQQQLLSSNYSALQFNTENLSSGMYLIGVKGTNINPTFIKLINIR